MSEQAASNSSDSTNPGDKLRIETATIEDLGEITELVMELLESQGDFTPIRSAQENGLRLILESPNRGRIFILRNDHHIVGVVNLLFTISTAVGGMVILLEDFIIHPSHRGQGYGERLLRFVRKFARDKKFLRITLLTDKLSSKSQKFFIAQGFHYSSMVPMRMMVES
ncbi:MAG: GNAT family N-acetyltransferase [Akkermansiaceae bacterium]